MNRLTVLVLRAIIIAGVPISLAVQAIFVISTINDARSRQPDALTFVLPALVIAAIVAGQAVLVCVWRLLSLAANGTVFTPASFRYVDGIIRAVAAVAVLVLAFGALLAPGQDAAPGFVLIIGGVGLACVGAALVVLVLRALLAQAIAREREARGLRAELDEVI